MYLYTSIRCRFCETCAARKYISRCLCSRWRDYDDNDNDGTLCSKGVEVSRGRCRCRYRAGRGRKTSLFSNALVNWPIKGSTDLSSPHGSPSVNRRRNNLMISLGIIILSSILRSTMIVSRFRGSTVPRSQSISVMSDQTIAPPLITSSLWNTYIGILYTPMYGGIKIMQVRCTLCTSVRPVCVHLLPHGELPSLFPSSRFIYIPWTPIFWSPKYCRELCAYL